jgi:hypothetical protein
MICSSLRECRLICCIIDKISRLDIRKFIGHIHGLYDGIFGYLRAKIPLL